MRNDYIKPSINILTIEPIKPLASSGITKIFTDWVPWKRNINWDDDGVGGWALNGSLEYDNGYPYVRSDNAVKGGYKGEWYYTLEIIDH